MVAQLAKALGLSVVGICGPKNVEFVKGLGADEVRRVAETPTGGNRQAANPVGTPVRAWLLRQAWRPGLRANRRAWFVCCWLQPHHHVFGVLFLPPSSRQVVDYSSQNVGELYKVRAALLCALLKNGRWQNLNQRFWHVSSLARAALDLPTVAGSCLRQRGTLLPFIRRCRMRHLTLPSTAWAPAVRPAAAPVCLCCCVPWWRARWFSGIWDVQAAEFCKRAAPLCSRVRSSAPLCAVAYAPGIHSWHSLVITLLLRPPNLPAGALLQAMLSVTKPSGHLSHILNVSCKGVGHDAGRRGR